MPLRKIDESSVEFIFDSDRLYVPEEDDGFREHKRFQHVTVCDFICIGLPNENELEKLLIAEVKTDAPKAPEAVERFGKKIASKFNDSLLTYVGAWANRHNTKDTKMLPLFRTPDALKREMTFALIITSPKYKDRWLVDLERELRNYYKHLEIAFSMRKTKILTLSLAQKELTSEYGFEAKRKPTK